MIKGSARKRANPTRKRAEAPITAAERLMIGDPVHSLWFWSVLPDRAARGVGDGCDDPPCRLAMVAATTMGARNREVSWAYSSDHGEMVAIEDRLTTISP
jgi:hypothetical protein